MLLSMINCVSWTADQVFNWNNVVVIGWLALIFAPFHKLSKYLILLLSMFISISYSMILFERLSYQDSSNSPLNLLHLTGWESLLKDPLLITSTISHLRVVDLLIGQWMVYDFYSGYTFAYSITTNSNGIY